MKALILSDVHANIVALEAVWQREGDSDAVYCAGDLVDYGPFPREVIAWVRAHDVVCVQGNHDRFVVRCSRCGDTADTVAPPARLWAHHNAARLEAADIAFLEQLPRALTFTLDGVRYGMTHLYRDYDEIVSLHAFGQFRAAHFDGVAPEALTRLILGHTHRQAVRYLSDAHLWLNPGSVSFRRPDDPDQTAHYAVIADGIISLRRVPYDLAPLRAAVAAAELKPSELRAGRRFFGPRDRAAADDGADA